MRIIKNTQVIWLNVTLPNGLFQNNLGKFSFIPKLFRDAHLIDFLINWQEKSGSPMVLPHVQMKLKLNENLV